MRCTWCCCGRYRLKYQKQELESYWNRNYKDFFDYACNAYDKAGPSRTIVTSARPCSPPHIETSRNVIIQDPFVRQKCDYIQKPDGTWEIGTKPDGPKWNLQETKRAGSGMMK